MTEGGPRRRVTTADVLSVFDQRPDDTEPLTAPEVADALGCSRRTALDRLHELEDEGAVASKKVGGRSLVWWVPQPPDGGADPSDGEVFTGGPLFASGEPLDESDIDEVLYGETDPEQHG